MASAGRASPSCRSPTGMLNSTQWVNVPRGASGSSQIRAKLFVRSGGSVHANGGGVSRPSPVYCFGMGWPSAKAVLVSFRLIARLPPLIDSHAGGVRLRHLALVAGVDLVQRVQRLRLVQVQKGVIAARQDRRDVVAELLPFGVIDHADGAVPARRQQLGRPHPGGEEQLVLRAGAV